MDIKLFNAIYYLVTIVTIGILLSDRKNILDYAKKVKEHAEELQERIRNFYGEV